MSGENDFVLHGYWRSSAAYRVRIALNLKNLSYAQVTHDLRRGGQSASDYVAIAPHGLVPALETGHGVLIESPAILEYLEECFPDPPLLPAAPDARAIVRAMAALVACEIHPLNNSGVLTYLRHDLAAGAEVITAWIATWIARGFIALEELVRQHGGLYAFGDSPTFADIYLVPQVYNAERFGVDLRPYPHLMGCATRARDHSAFAAARPEAQPDAA